MARIPLVFEDQIWVMGSIVISGIHSAPAIVRFAVDTGSPYTILSLNECRRLNIPQAILQQDRQLKLGGTTHYRMLINRKTSLLLRAEDQRIQTFAYDYGIIFPVAQTRASIANALSLPSLLGLDFLKDNKLRFVCDAAEGIAYLETA